MEWVVRLAGSTRYPAGTLVSGSGGVDHRRPDGVGYYTIFPTREAARRCAAHMRSQYPTLTYRVEQLVTEQLVLDVPEHDDEDEMEDVYINDSCPEECAIDHDTDDHFQCEATGVYYARCQSCGEVNRSTRWDDRAYVECDEMYVCSDCLLNYSSCDDCGEYVSVTHETRGGEHYCSGCFEYYLENSQSQGRADGEAIVTCNTCNTGNVHLDELTEEWLCQHLAAERRARKVPVLV